MDLWWWLIRYAAPPVQDKHLIVPDEDLAVNSLAHGALGGLVYHRLATSRARS
jgi:hypothetical protein